MATNSEPPKTFTDASSPFDDPSADIIIRSYEGVDFRTHKLLLTLASPFFKGMFELPQPASTNYEEKERFKSDGTRDGIPVISLYDDRNEVCGKDVVEYVLSSCHPAYYLQLGKPSLSAELVGAVVDVATRYDMDWAARMALRDPHLLETEPLLLFANACRKGWAAEATLAAQETLRFRVADFPHDPALKLITGFQYHSLLEFHRRCGRAAKNIALQEDGHQWISQKVLELFLHRHDRCSSDQTWDDKLDFSSQPSSRYVGRQVCPKWWANYMQSTATNLETRPHSSTVEDHSTFDAAIQDACDTCLRSSLYPLMRNLIPEFKGQVGLAIHQISELPESSFV
ncbi:hypothetical protein B0H11DRAFT_1981374 [Mycena galericulata]|nr:hypothetical protein B0H11DRAFT_1981374 [Mycena galericulata]